MKLYFNDDEIALFKHILSKEDYEALFGLSIVNDNAVREVLLTKEEIEKLLDLISSELMKAGFNQNWQPNALGAKIESLIDKLNGPLFD